MKQKFARLLGLVAAVAAAACVWATGAFAMGTDLTTVNADCLLRIGPGQEYESLAEIPSGAQVYIDTADNGNGWAYVIYSDQNGWVPTRFLSNEAARQEASTSAGGISYTTTTNAVYLRSGASRSYAAYTLVPAGASVGVDSVSNGWAHAYYGNYEGYIYAQYLNGYAASSSSTMNSNTSTTSTTSGSTWYGGHNYANVYDYNYYRSNYADLRAAFGDNADAYLQHFVNHGMSEGRQAISSFNVYQYRSEHPDLEARFGDDLTKYYLWACGIPF